MTRSLMVMILCCAQLAFAQTIPIATPAASKPTAARGAKCGQDEDSPKVINCRIQNGKLQVSCTGMSCSPNQYHMVLKYDESESKVDIVKFCKAAHHIFNESNDQKFRYPKNVVLCPPPNQVPEGGLEQWLDDNTRAICSKIGSRTDPEIKELSSGLCNSSGASGKSKSTNSGAR